MSRPYDKNGWDRAKAAAPTVLVAQGSDSVSERLDAFVDGHIYRAGRKVTVFQRNAHLRSWARFLNDQIELLAAGRDLPTHMAGLDAITLANARDRLYAATKETK